MCSLSVACRHGPEVPKFVSMAGCFETAIRKHTSAYNADLNNGGASGSPAELFAAASLEIRRTIFIRLISSTTAGLSRFIPLNHPREFG